MYLYQMEGDSLEDCKAGCKKDPKGAVEECNEVCHLVILVFLFIHTDNLGSLCQNNIFRLVTRYSAYLRGSPSQLSLSVSSLLLSLLSSSLLFSERNAALQPLHKRVGEHELAVGHCIVYFGVAASKNCIFLS